MLEPHAQGVLTPTVATPRFADVIRAALSLRAASLVVFRHRLLVEFKTERLGAGLTRYEEDGHVSWQVGDFDDHHCHLDIDACAEVVFGAEPVGCQGGRLNYTIWFLTDGDAGNPHRPRAYFSVTLNRPYGADGRALRDVIEPVFDLHRRFEDRAGVSAEPTFLLAMEDPAFMDALPVSPASGLATSRGE